MTKPVRGLKGWPPESTTRPASAQELARARQTGQTVKQLRQEQAKVEAADVSQRVLDLDGQPESGTLARQGDWGLTRQQRWALHLAVAVLRGGKP